MALQYTQPTGNYLDVLKAFIKAVEDEFPDPYVDTVGVPTIGWGFALKSGRVKAELLPHLLGEVLGINSGRAGLSGNVSQPGVSEAGARGREQYYFKELKKVLDRTWAPDNTANKQGSSLLLQAALNDVLVRRAAEIADENSTYYNAQDRALLANPVTSFAYANRADIAIAFERIKPEYDRSLNNNFSSPPESLERIALFSLIYQGQVSTSSQSPAHFDFGNKIRDALQIGTAPESRAEAWYTIRYAKRPLLHSWRAYMESAVFGLYSDANNIGVDDANS